MGMDFGGRDAEIGFKILAGIIIGAAFFVGFTLGFAACVFL